MKLKNIAVTVIVAVAMLSLESCKKDEIELSKDKFENLEQNKQASTSGTPSTSIKADFTYQISNADQYPISVTFTNNSIGSTHYEWNFGNGEMARTKNPTALYNSSIVYKVKLVAKKGNKSNTVEKIVSIPNLDKSVRIIYIIPNDKQPNSTYLNAITNAAPNLQSWYKTQMSGKTYRLNNPLINTLYSSHNTAWFNNNNGNSGDNPQYFFFYNAYNDARELLGLQWDTNNYTYTIYVDAPGGTGAGSLGFCVLPEHDLKGISGQMSEPVSRWIGGWGHEVGHAFGLPHPDNQQTDAIMWTGYTTYPNCILLPSDKTTLQNSGFFF